MGKYISFGKYNKLYKYIWFFVLIRILIEYIFGDSFPDQIRPNIFYSVNYSPNKLIQIFFNYLGAFVLSIFLYLYEKSILKKKKVEQSNNDNNTSLLLFDYKLIYLENKNYYEIKTITIFSIIAIISVESIEILMGMGFSELVFWEFDLFIIANVNLILFANLLYSHKKFAIFCVTFFSSLFQILSTFELLFNEKYNLFYKNHIILIPIVIIIYPCLSLIKFYAICKIKWLLDNKFIPFGVFFSLFSFLAM